MLEKTERFEVKAIIKTIEQLIPNYQPKILYTLIDKLSGHRLFMKSNGDTWNPQQGTVVDSAVVECQGDRIFDYFMIPHKATVATA